MEVPVYLKASGLCWRRTMMAHICTDRRGGCGGGRCGPFVATGFYSVFFRTGRVPTR